MILGWGLLAALSGGVQAPAADSGGGNGRGALISRLDVSSFPSARAWVRFNVSPGLAVRRVRAGDVRARVDSAPVRVVDLRAEPGPARTVVLVIPAPGDPSSAGSRLAQAAREFAVRAVAGDRLVAVVTGKHGPVVEGPDHPSRALEQARQSLADSAVVDGWAVLDRADAVLRGLAGGAELVVLLPGGVRLGSARLTRLARGVGSGKTMILTGGRMDAGRAESVRRLGAIDAGSDIAAAVRRALMVAPVDSAAADELALELPGAQEGTPQALSIGLVTPIAGLDPAGMEATVPFIALAPGRAAVGGLERPASGPDLRLVGTGIAFAVAVLSLAGLLLVRRMRA